MTTRRTAMSITTLAAWPWLTGLGWPQIFDLSWVEEVQLHDGRVIDVHLKFTYERLSRLSQYERAILRSVEMSFDAGPPYGRVTQLFKRQQPSMLDSKNGQWYVVLDELAGLSLIRDEDWGPTQNQTGGRVGILKEGQFKPAWLHELPSEFTKPNFLYQYGPLEEVARFDKTTVTLQQKSAWLAIHPLAPVDQSIGRPNPSVYEQMKLKGKLK